MFMSIFFVAFVAQSGLEWKIVKSNPRLKEHFHGIKGMIISAFIGIVMGAVVGTAMGAVAGGAVTLAAMLGMFTNEFTFNAFERISRLNNQRKEVTTKVNDIRTKHGSLITNVWGTAKLGIAAVLTVVVIALWIIGAPVMFCKKVRAGVKSAQARLSSRKVVMA